MKNIGWDKLKKTYHLGLPEGRNALLVWHAIPVNPKQPIGSITAPIKSVTKATSIDDLLTSLGEREGESGLLWAIKASELPLGSSHLATMNPLVAQVMERLPRCLIIPVFEDRIASVIQYGDPLQGETAKGEQVRQSLYDLGEMVYRLRPGFSEHLGWASLRALKQRWSGVVVIDGFQQGRELTGGKLLAASWRLADWIKEQAPGKRLGIVLPPGLGATVANLACVLADVVPVNMNFTAGRLTNEAALKKAEVTMLVTAEAMKTKVKDFPWPDQTIDLKEVMLGFSKLSLAWRWLVATVLPASLLRFWIGVPRQGGDREAVLLFTSGSAGDPKGVALTHRNLIANVRQIDAVLSLGPIKSMLACLPIFHSFGATVTVWWPILGGPKAITYVSPTETSKLIDLVEKYEVDLLLHTPTFLRNFLRKAQAKQLESLKIVVTGAEKLPLDLRAEFEEKFQVPVCEGFGMTEASPVVAVNLISFDDQPGTAEYEAPRRIGSVGHLVPGISFRIRNPETGEALPLGSSGMVWLRGANIFPGYLGSPLQTAEVLVDGWYATGDVGKVDEDGFLYIEGRLSRFSKIAGEMVPHGVIESKLMDLYRAELGEEFLAVVVGVPDPGKGECLVALVNHAVNAGEARAKLAATGLPNLWLPREYLLVESIPTLGTGKLDLKACRQLVLQKMG